jgi:Na+/phosphate symporter
MGVAVWFIVLGLLYALVKYFFARVVQGKSKEQLELESLNSEYIKLLANDSIFMTKNKKERLVKEMEEKIEKLEEKIKQ